MNFVLKKTLSILIVLLLLFLCAGIVSAADADDNSYSVSEDLSDSSVDVEKMGVSENQLLESKIKASGNSFDDIQAAINKAKENDVIELSGTYKTSYDQLNLNKSLTIQGSSKGATLDFDGTDFCWYVGSSEEILDDEGYYMEDKYNPLNVVFKNLNFINSQGAVFAENSNLTVINCTFINNKISFDEYGGGAAISCNNFDFDCILKLQDSKFINSTGYLAGAVFADNVIVKNCIFDNNYAYNGGAISALNVSVTDSKFNNNKAENYGAAILVENGFVTVDNTEFDNNYAGAKGSAIYVGAQDGSHLALMLTDSKFSNNRAGYESVSFGSLNYIDRDAGSVVIEYFGSKVKYNISNCTGLDKKFTKTPATLTAAKVSTSYNSGKTFTVKIIDKKTKKGVKNALVWLTINKNMGDEQIYTNSKGIATLKLTNFKPNTYKVTVRIYDKYSPCKTTSTIKISKAPTIVKAPKITAKAKKSKYFKVTVKSKATKKILKNIKVKIKVYTGKKYKTFTTKTNKKGIAKINTKSLKKGKHKVIITSGNTNYKISAKSTIKIK